MDMTTLCIHSPHPTLLQANSGPNEFIPQFYPSNYQRRRATCCSRDSTRRLNKIKLSSHVQEERTDTELNNETDESYKNKKKHLKV